MKKNLSQWEETKTFFPLFLRRLKTFSEAKSVLIVGASDGKFVLPLAESGYQVEAIDIDEVALYGGKVEFPKGKTLYVEGLEKRLERDRLSKFVRIRHADFICPNVVTESHDAVFTSCSWHYSRNHNIPLYDFVQKMQDSLSSNGIFCAEYMMPVEVKHFATNHYLREGQLANLFPNPEWIVLEDFYTQPFIEQPHIGNLCKHVHRMGFFMAVKR